MEAYLMLNKVILIGRLTRDVDTRYMPNGDAVSNFGLATNETWKDKNGEKQERVEFHNITIYRKLAEIAGQYLKKGSQVYVEGKIQSNKYTGKDGIERTAYNIVVSEMTMLGSKDNQAQPNTPPPAPPTAQPQRTTAQPVDDIDDDLPF